MKSWEVADKEVLRSKTLLVSRTFAGVEREVPSGAPVGDVDLAPGEILPDDELDEGLAMKKQWPRKSNRPGIVIAQNYWAWVTNKPEQHSERNWNGDFHLDFWQQIYQSIAQIRAMLCVAWGRLHVLCVCGFDLS